MDGQPVWLASASLADRHGVPVPSEEWMVRPDERERMAKALRRALDGVGDESRQRLFRMPITMCLHRAMTDDEVAGLPDGCELTAMGLAGGGLEILWETVPGSLSTRPCENPTLTPIDRFRPQVTRITECGDCPPCQARARAEERL